MAKYCHCQKNHPKGEDIMKISKALNQFFSYQKLNIKKNTIQNYEFVLTRFQDHFGEIELSSITSDNILEFMTKISGNTKQNTKKLRFTLLAAFLNYIKNSASDAMR